MEGRHEGLEPLDRAYDLSSLSGEVEAVGRGDRSMQQCPPAAFGLLVQRETEAALLQGCSAWLLVEEGEDDRREQRGDGQVVMGQAGRMASA